MKIDLEKLYNVDRELIKTFGNYSENFHKYVGVPLSMCIGVVPLVYIEKIIDTYKELETSRSCIILHKEIKAELLKREQSPDWDTIHNLQRSAYNNKRYYGLSKETTSNENH